MALQGGFKVGGLVILASGSGYGHGQTYNKVVDLQEQLVLRME